MSDAALQQAEAAIAELQGLHQYEGRQWISSHYLSVEPVEGTTGQIQVTVRETWSDTLATYPGSDPFGRYKQGIAEPVTADRGPYVIDVVYMLEPVQTDCDPELYTCYRWRVVSWTELTPRPEWVSR